LVLAAAKSCDVNDDGLAFYEDGVLSAVRSGVNVSVEIVLHVCCRIIDAIPLKSGPSFTASSGEFWTIS
jgi:hypothetical protein